MEALMTARQLPPSCSSAGARLGAASRPAGRSAAFSCPAPRNSITSRKLDFKAKCSNDVTSTVSEPATEPASEPAVLKASSMPETYDLLAQRLLQVALDDSSDKKYIVGIAGPPGAGKSTVSTEVAKRLNELYRAAKKSPSSSDIAIAVPMDGFHLYRFQLDAMEDPTEAHARRGAPWTFNPQAFWLCLSTLRSKNWAYFPSFDHGVGDPIEQDIEVTVKHKIVIVEGNYLLLKDPDWKKVGQIFDERWFINVDLDTAMNRVVNRHISTGKPKDVAAERVAYNDRPNAELVQETMGSADLVIHSINLS